MCAASNVCEQDESLIALTTHLAQVQFRLRQVIIAPDESKEVMLKELEEFVMKGCHGNIPNKDMVQHTIELPSDSQSELVKKGYELSNRMDMQHEDVSELKMTSATFDDDHLQSTSLLSDHDDHLESVTIRTESCHPQDIGCHGDYIDYVKQTEEISHDPSPPVVKVQPIRIEGFGSNDLNLQQCSKDDKQSYLNVQLMRLISLLQCGCGISPQWYRHSNHIQSNTNNTSHATRHLHSLSRAIDRISMLVRMTELDHMTSVKMTTIEVELHTAVTMEMADSLLQLLSDGLINKVGIFSKYLSSQPLSPWQHKVWLLLQAYCNDKRQVVHPTQSLATSFDLPLSDKNSPKKTLIHMIQLMEKYYEQFPDGPLCDELKFRALICKGFNLKHLSSWVQLLANHKSLLQSSYSSQSFALQTGFQPIIIQLKRLNELAIVPEVSLPTEQPILSHQYSIT